MIFELHFSDEAKDQLRNLKEDKALAKRYKAVKGALKNYSRIQDIIVYKYTPIIL